MHSLNEIIALNNKAADAAKRRAAEDNFNRQCSYCGSVKEGVVLHSARHRSTRFLPAGSCAATTFLDRWAQSSNRNALVESHFS